LIKKTFVDVLLELPVDATLRNFLSLHGLPVPAGFGWQDTPETSQALVAAVKAWPDSAARDRMSASLMDSIQLSNATGKQAIFEAVINDAPVLAQLVLCCSDVHRSFWLYVNHPALFERACDLNYWEHHCSKTQQFDLGIKRQPIITQDASLALRRAISAFYKRQLQCGDSSVAHLVERSPGVFLLTVHVQDRVTLQLEFEGPALKRRQNHPCVQMMLEYSRHTGVVRTLVRGGLRYQQMLIQAFCAHVLGVQIDACQIKPPTLDLSMLRTGFDVPQVFRDGFSRVQLKAITLLSPGGALKIKCTAMHSSQQRCVHELIRDKLPCPFNGQWTVAAALVNLYYPPESGRMRAKMVTIEITHKGRLNLHKFDARLQAQLEGYLVSAGILQKGQTLSTQEIAPEAQAIGSLPACQD
jgi:hypothetical protein